MAASMKRVFRDVRAWARQHDIVVRRRRMTAGKAGTFDGVSVTMNTSYPQEEEIYYLMHALGSIVRWSLSGADVQRMFDELRAVKATPDKARLEKAIESYRAFENEASEFAVAVFEKLGHTEVIAPYTNFMRADLEALTEFHRHGKAPIWRDFFARWNAEVAAGQRQVLAFEPKPVPPFTPQLIEKQEILQEQGEPPARAASYG